MSDPLEIFTDPAKPPRAPQGLGAAGRNLYAAITRRYQIRYADELPLVVQAAHVADLISDLQEALKGADLVVLGSQKQQVSNPLLSEIRAARTQLAALFRQLNLPNDEVDEGKPQKDPQRSKAAQSRWAREARLKEAERQRGEMGGQ